MADLQGYRFLAFSVRFLLIFSLIRIRRAMFIDFQGESMTFIVRLIVAALLGALIGLERDIHGRLRDCALAC